MHREPDRYGADNIANPSVLWTLTPRITSLDVEYYGMMWPNNSAVGATYGGILAGLAESLAIPPPVAAMGASPAAPAEAASAIGEAAADTAAGDGMRSAFQGVQTGTNGAGQSAWAGEGLSTFMEPVQSMMGAVPQVLQAPSGLMQAPMSAMQPLQSIMGMFANLAPWAGRRQGRRCRRAERFRPPRPGLRPGRRRVCLGRRRHAATSFTRPVSAFEPATSGRPVGLRPSGALGAEAVRAPTTTTSGGPIGGMPVGPQPEAIADPTASPNSPRRCGLSTTGL